MSNSELAASYAALILADDEIEITVCRVRPDGKAIAAYRIPQADKLQTIIKAANVEDVEAIWTTLFAKVLAMSPLRKWNCYRRHTVDNDHVGS